MSPVATGAVAGIADRIATIQARIQSLDASRTAHTSAAEAGSNRSGFTIDTEHSTAFATVLEKTINSANTAPATSTVHASTTHASTAAGPASATGTTSTGATSTTAVSPSTAAGAVTGADVVASAKKYLGVPYVWGGTTTDGLDCSGLVQLAYRDLGFEVPRVSRNQATAGVAVPSMDQARPGDIIAFGNPVDHVAIYAGNNRIIEAPQAGADVHITEIYRDPVAIRRVVSVDAGDMSTSDSSAGQSAVGAPGAAASTDSAAPDSTAGSVRASTLAVPPGFPDLWNDAKLAGVPRAVPLANLGITAGEASDSGTAGASVATDGANPSDFAASFAAALAGGGLTEARLNAAGISDAVARYLGDFTAASTTYDLPRGLLAAVAQAESGGNPNAVSPAGAQGLMQLMPTTAAGLGVANPFDAHQAIDGAAKLLSGHLSRFGGSIPLSLAAYNAGAGAVEQYGGIPPYAETQQYVQKITDMLARLA